VDRFSPVIRDPGAGSARLLVMAARLAEAVASPWPWSTRHAPWSRKASITYRGALNMGEMSAGW